MAVIKTNKTFFKKLTAIFVGCSKRATESLLKRKLLFGLGNRPMGFFNRGKLQPGASEREGVLKYSQVSLPPKVTGIREWVPPTIAELRRVRLWKRDCKQKALWESRERAPEGHSERAANNSSSKRRFHIALATVLPSVQFYVVPHFAV